MLAHTCISYLGLSVKAKLFNSFFSFKILFIFRERKRGWKRRRETWVCGCLLHGPHWGPGLQPRHVPWWGIEPATLWFTARAQSTQLHQPGLLLDTFNVCLVFCCIFVSWLIDIWLFITDGNLGCLQFFGVASFDH